MTAPAWHTYTAENMPEPGELVWTWEDRMLRGQTAFIAAPGGTGKSVMVWALAFAVATGRPFLNAETTKAPVLYLDFDAEPSTQSFMAAKVRRGMGIPPSAVDDVHYHAPRPAGSVLNSDRFQQVLDWIHDLRPGLVILDAFSSALYQVRSNDTEAVAGLMAQLRTLTEPIGDRPGPTLLVVDHTPKPSGPKGPSVLDRGVMGSSMKTNAARSAYLLLRVPPRDVDGRDVLALHTQKNNLGPLHDPIGVERVWHPESVVMTVTDLPEAENSAPTLRRAIAAIREGLDADAWVTRKSLIRSVVNRANAQERTVASALSQLVERGVVQSRPDDDDARVRLYRLAPVVPGEGE